MNSDAKGIVTCVGLEKSFFLLLKKKKGMLRVECCKRLCVQRIDFSTDF